MGIHDEDMRIRAYHVDGGRTRHAMLCALITAASTLAGCVVNAPWNG
jgi:hypothetical protein